MRRLSIIGCGNAARTLGRLWHEAGYFEIAGILNRRFESSREAADFIGAGDAVGSIDALPDSDSFLIGTPDAAIGTACEALAQSRKLNQGITVFHLSGALASSILEPARKAGASVAGIHPVKSFADPAQSILDFNGTWCGCEGDPEALAELKPAFEQIGARLFDIDAASKTLYHAASVVACNYLVALEEVSLQAFEQAGVSRELGLQILEPILHGTVDNIVKLDTTEALTGPIARGDAETVARQLRALEAWNPEFAELYRRLGRIAADLSQKQGNVSEAALVKIRALLES
jgi:predicted short-subunit dehydrogenase-like oxidoreductase (DUF2520 family)